MNVGEFVNTAWGDASKASKWSNGPISRIEKGASIVVPGKLVHRSVTL